MFCFLTPPGQARGQTRRYEARFGGSDSVRPDRDYIPCVCLSHINPLSRRAELESKHAHVVWVVDRIPTRFIYLVVPRGQARSSGTSCSRPGEIKGAGPEPTVVNDATDQSTEERLPDGWVVWADDAGGRTVFAYRPGLFDGAQFPAPCLPTIYVSDGSRRPRPGAGSRRTDEWHAKLFLEPEVDVETRVFDDREAALDGAVDIAERFAHGQIDYRAAYQVPREEYLERLDTLVGRDG